MLAGDKGEQSIWAFVCVDAHMVKSIVPVLESDVRN
jgi:hypothetical protein